MIVFALGWACGVVSAVLFVLAVVWLLRGEPEPVTGPVDIPSLRPILLTDEYVEPLPPRLVADPAGSYWTFGESEAPRPIVLTEEHRERPASRISAAFNRTMGN